MRHSRGGQRHKWAVKSERNFANFIGVFGVKQSSQTEPVWQDVIHDGSHYHPMKTLCAMMDKGRIK